MKELREAAGFTQTEMSIIIGCDKTYISLVETGKIKSKQVDRLIKFATACGVTVEELFKK